MKIQTDKFLDKLEGSKYGTGSIADEIGVENDAIVALIEKGEGSEELISELEDVLGVWGEDSGDNKAPVDLEDKTVLEIKEMIKEGSLNPEPVLSFEKSRDKEDRRVTLIEWLE